MLFVRLLLLVFTLFIISFDIGRAFDCKINPKNPSKVAREIVVDLNGHGNFSRIQDAINSVPSKNEQWILIRIHSGRYREQVVVPRDRTCIKLEGNRFGDTIIEWDDHTTTASSPTFSALADNFVAKHLTFKNTYNHGLTTNEIKERKPAVAVLVDGDKASFRRCIFYGIQDTLWDNKGRHYFYQCHITGNVDFIFGNGQSLYVDNYIRIEGSYLPKSGYGVITAQGRTSDQEPTGFVFKGGRVDGGRAALLGRAYRSHSRVILDGVRLEPVILSRGWDNWNLSTSNIFYAEGNCKGGGSSLAGRVEWEKKLDPSEIRKFSDMSFIDQANEQWVSKQP